MSYNNGTGYPIIDGYPMLAEIGTGNFMPVWDNVGDEKYLLVKIYHDEPIDYAGGWPLVWADAFIDGVLPPGYFSHWGGDAGLPAGGSTNVVTAFGPFTNPNPYWEPLFYTTLTRFHAFKTGGGEGFERLVSIKLDRFHAFKRRLKIRMAAMWRTDERYGYTPPTLPPPSPTVMNYAITAWISTSGNFEYPVDEVTKSGAMAWDYLVGSFPTMPLGESFQIASVLVNGTGEVVIT